MKKMLLPILLRLIIYPSALCLVFSAVMFYLYAHPKRYVSPSNLGRVAGAAENIRLTASDGVELDGWFIPNTKSDKALIICHGYPMDKGNVLGFTSFLAKDFNLLLFDFRAMGKSGGYFSTGGWRETKDVTAAVNFLKAKGFAHIGAFGFSMGAILACMVGSKYSYRKLILASMTPVLDLSKPTLNMLGKKISDDCKKFKYGGLKATYFYGEKEIDESLDRIKKFGIKVIPNTHHQLNAEYIEHISREI